MTSEHIRLELWASARTIATGMPLTVGGRATNLGTTPIWYDGRPCAQLIVGLVRFPAFDVYGSRLSGVAAHVKDAWARGDGTPTDRYTRPEANSFFGALAPARGAPCDPEADEAPPLTRLAAGGSATLTVSGALEWSAGPLPQGPAQLGALFSYGDSQHFQGPGHPVYASVPVSVGGGAATITPGDALDLALTAPGVPAYLQAHARDTQLTADPRLSADSWTVRLQAINVTASTKSVTPALVVKLDRGSGKVLSVTPA